MTQSTTYRQYQKQYYYEHKEKRKQYALAYYYAHSKQQKERHRVYNKAHYNPTKRHEYYIKTIVKEAARPCVLQERAVCPKRQQATAEESIKPQTIVKEAQNGK